MFIGHFAPAFIAATHPKAPPLGVLIVAAQLVDIACFIFILTGVEAMRIVPGFTAMNPMDLYHMPYTHSLLGTLIWAGGAALVVGAMTRNRIAALIAACVVVSHWFLDVLVHAPDMTLWGMAPKLGLGLWNYPLIEMPLELGLIGASFGYYISRTRDITGPKSGQGLWMPAVAALLLVLQLYNWLSPEPTEMSAMLPIMALVAFGVIFIATTKLGASRQLLGAGRI
jgi:hypothetical protein